MKLVFADLKTFVLEKRIKVFFFVFIFYRGSQWNIDSFINGFANILNENLNGGKLSRGLYYRAIDVKMSERAGIIVKSFRKGMLPGKECKNIVTLKKLFPVLATG